MLILFDNGPPAPLRYAPKSHIVVEAIERGWDRLVNGEPIAVVEPQAFMLDLTSEIDDALQPWTCPIAAAPSNAIKPR
jgi:hypothetical protein